MLAPKQVSPRILPPQHNLPLCSPVSAPSCLHVCLPARPSLLKPFPTTHSAPHRSSTHDIRPPPYTRLRALLPRLFCLMPSQQRLSSLSDQMAWEVRVLPGWSSRVGCVPPQLTAYSGQGSGSPLRLGGPWGPLLPLTLPSSCFRPPGRECPGKETVPSS